MKSWILRSSTLLVASFYVGIGSADARTFTDDQGRTIEADLIAVQDEYAVISKNGRSARWPIAKFSKKDQAYIELWQKDPASTPKFTINLWERDGIGPEGPLNYREVGGEGLPFVQTEKKARYKHFDVDLRAQTKADGRNLTLAYTLYYYSGGTAVPTSGTTSIELVPAGESKRVQTKGLAVMRVKQTTTLPTINTGPGGGIGTSSSSNTTKDHFGGVWVRVYASDGSVVGEAKKLQADVAKQQTAWTGPKAQGTDIPLLEAFEKLSEFLDELPELPPLPQLPDLPKPLKPPLTGGGTKPSFPPKPPGLP